MPQFEIENYDDNVFINCPFDENYSEIMDSMLFTIIHCNFIPLIAKDLSAAGNVRLNNIYNLIKHSKYLINDLSRIELDKGTNLPRFNMPLELGICLGAKEYGQKKHKNKNILLIESEKFKSQHYISDLSGIDFKVHDNNYQKAISIVRNWLSNFKKNEILTGNDIIIKNYNNFKEKYPSILSEYGLSGKIENCDKLNIMNKFIQELVIK